MIHVSKKFSFNSARGFTVMEMVVATGIFAILILATLGIFSSVLQAQQDTLAQSRIEREAQLVLETIAKKIRTSRVDYAEYESLFGSGNPIVNPVQELILIDQTDSRVRYLHDSVNKNVDVRVNSGSSNPMTIVAVDVNKLDFYIEPTTDPFVSGLLPVTQPRVTIVLEMSASEGRQRATTTMQQTVPQRGAGY